MGHTLPSRKRGFDETMTHVGGLISSSTRDNLNVMYSAFTSRKCVRCLMNSPFLISWLDDSVWGFRWGKGWVEKSRSRAAQLGQTDVCGWHGFAWQTLGIGEGKKISARLFAFSKSFLLAASWSPLGGLCRNRTCFPVQEVGLLLLVSELQLVASILVWW